MTLRPELVLPFMVLACAQNPKPSAEGSVLSGTVAYRERIALPQDAVVQVQLSDVSVQDAAAPVIAETTVKPEGRQVPLPFELRYDPSKLDPKRTYAVRATIRSGGQLRFTTTTVTPVLTRGTRAEPISCSHAPAAKPRVRPARCGERYGGWRISPVPV